MVHAAANEPNRDVLRHSGETLKKSIDFPTFLRTMIRLVWNIAKQNDVDAMVRSSITLENYSIEYPSQS